MRIFISSNTLTDRSAYLAEILHAFGWCGAELLPLPEALQIANPDRDLIILPPGAATDGIEEFLKRGGGVIAIQPKGPLARLAGLVPAGEESGPVRLRLTKPLCFGERGEPLLTVGPIQRYGPIPDEQGLAYIYRPGVSASESIGIAEAQVGEGILVSYAYDPMACVARLRQGDPQRANYLPVSEKTPRATYLHESEPPADTAWRPTADLHAWVLGGSIRHLLHRKAPAPLLWHLPRGASAMVLLSGDEDVSPQENNEKQMLNVESYGGSMSLYIIPDLTSITPANIEDYTRRGHTISVHPNLTGEAGRPMSAQLAQAEKQVRLFKEKFRRPVHTLRNHCYVWPGYLDLPEVWERLEVGMDTNTTGTLYGQSPEFGPFVNVNGAIPLKFVRENGSLINVYQQPTHLNDDILCSPNSYSLKYSVQQFDWIVQRIFEDAVRFFHAPICVNFHPWSYVNYSGSHARVVASRARELGFPIWSVDRWYHFWKARAAWKIGQSSWDGANLDLHLSGPSCEDLALVFPLHFGPGTIQAVTVEETSINWESKKLLGSDTAVVLLPGGLDALAVRVTYGSRN